MARKTFISYKYSEAQKLRDDIIKALGKDATYYNGEDGYTEDMSDLKADTIKKKLKDMIYDTSVTIVILSPNMLDSDWIDWEIEYSLKSITRKDRTSRPNGIVAVIKKVNGGYGWLKTTTTHKNGKTSSNYDSNKLFDIISDNRFNQYPQVYIDSVNKTYDRLTGSYISIIEEEEFVDKPSEFIENAYTKSENNASGYILKKTR